MCLTLLLPSDTLRYLWQSPGVSSYKSCPGLGKSRGWVSPRSQGRAGRAALVREARTSGQPAAFSPLIEELFQSCSDCSCGFHAGIPSTEPQNYHQGSSGMADQEWKSQTKKTLSAINEYCNTIEANYLYNLIQIKDIADAITL